MSYDGFVTRAVTHELNQKLLGGKIDKIYQPENDEIILSVRTFDGSFRLLLSANAMNARVCITEQKKENPMTPPMLCMLMRKHLLGGRITAITQMHYDRVIKLDIECHDELGDLVHKSIITEIMGRHSNIIFVDENGKITDSVKHVDFTVSAVRQVLPGFPYSPPPKQDKLPPENIDMIKFMNTLEKAGGGARLDKLLLDGFVGMSPLAAREIVCRFAGNTSALVDEIDTAHFVTFVNEFFENISSDKFDPCVVYERGTGKPAFFSCVYLSQYEGSCTIERFESISAAIDEYYTQRAAKESMRQKSADISKLVQNNISRCTKKLALHRDDLLKAGKRDKYKINGDLLTANLYRIKYGMDKVTVENFYDDNKPVTIKLDPTVSPSQNVQRLYKRYNKAKTTEKYAAEQIKEAEEELSYLESVHESIENAETPADLAEIKDELREQGYLPKRSAGSRKKQKKQKVSAPMKFRSSDGYEILVGRNNKQNDELTIRMSYSTDIWLHTKQIPGSHTLIRTNGTGKAPDSTIKEAACLAAYYSKARSSSQVPVDYTLIKNVKKPNGAKPGFVIYESNRTVYVTPKAPFIDPAR